MSFSLLVMAWSVAAEARRTCVVEGVGEAVDVIPRSSRTTRLHLSERLRVRFEGRLAKIGGLSPIALEGAAKPPDVRLYLREPKVLRGVLRASPGAAVQVVETKGGKPRIRPAIPDLSFPTVAVDCEALSFAVGPVATAGVAVVADSELVDVELPASIDVATPRSRSLRLYPSATDARGATLSGDALADLVFDILEERRGRLRIRAELAEGWAVDGWVAASSVKRGEVVGSSSPSLNGVGGCGYAFAGALRYRGAATLREGAELFDRGGRAFAKLAADTAAHIVILEQPDTTGGAEVLVESIEGIVKSPCEGSVAKVEIETVVMSGEGEKGE